MKGTVSSASIIHQSSKKTRVDPPAVHYGAVGTVRKPLPPRNASGPLSPTRPFTASAVFVETKVQSIIDIFRARSPSRGQSRSSTRGVEKLQAGTVIPSRSLSVHLNDATQEFLESSNAELLEGDTSAFAEATVLRELVLRHIIEAPLHARFAAIELRFAVSS